MRSIILFASSWMYFSFYYFISSLLLYLWVLYCCSPSRGNIVEKLFRNNRSSFKIVKWDGLSVHTKLKQTLKTCRTSNLSLHLSIYAIAVCRLKNSEQKNQFPWLNIHFNYAKLTHRLVPGFYMTFKLKQSSSLKFRVTDTEQWKATGFRDRRIFQGFLHKVGSAQALIVQDWKWRFFNSKYDKFKPAPYKILSLDRIKFCTTTK